MKSKLTHFSPFSDASLVVLISLVTLFLQLISFATTWNGAGVYLEGIFPYASLLFALAVQSTAYFLSNSLRRRITFLKVTALAVALCCSTYCSYIGIYQTVNPPVTYLREQYVRIAQEIGDIFYSRLDEEVSEAKRAVGEAVSAVASRYTALWEEREAASACEKALSEIQSSYTDGLRAPRQSAYENYEDYAAAYSAYIAGASAGSSAEKEAAQQQILSSFGYASMNAFRETQRNNSAALSALEAALPGQDKISALSAAQVSLQNAAANAALGTPLTETDLTLLDGLLQAAALCGHDTESLSHAAHALNACAQETSSSLMRDYPALTALLPGGAAGLGNAMELKSLMDAEIQSGLLSANALLSEKEQLSYSDPRFSITELYLVPVRALKEPSERMTAAFCLAAAALIDLLSVLFAVSLRRRRPLFERRSLLGSRFSDYAPQILAALPAAKEPAGTLRDFLGIFSPSPLTEADGYMLMAPTKSLTAYFPLAALLCQFNLARIVPSGFFENTEEVLLLKARFVFWANHMIHETQFSETES